MGDDARPRDASRVGLLVDHLDAAGVVDMAVRVDDGMDRAVVPAADAARVLAAVSGLAVSISTSPAAVRMAVTLPQKYVVWTVMMLSATAVMAPGDGLRPFLHWRCAAPKPLEKLVLFALHSSPVA